jgi:hypothetical protein
MADLDGLFDQTPYYQDEWFELMGAILPDGVINDGDGLVGTVTGLTTSPLRSQVGPIRMAARGVYRSLSTATIVEHTANSSGNPRIDRVVERIDTVARTITPTVVTGVAAASPSAPAIEAGATTFDLPLARVRVESGASAFPSDGSKHTDDRALYPSPTRAPRGELAYVRLTGDWEWAGASNPPTNQAWVVGSNSSQAGGLQTTGLYIPSGRRIHVHADIPWLGGTMVAGNVWEFTLTDNDTVLGSGRHVAIDSPVPSDQDGLHLSWRFTPALGVKVFALKLSRFTGGSGDKVTIRHDAYLAVDDLGAA